MMSRADPRSREPRLCLTCTETLVPPTPRPAARLLLPLAVVSSGAAAMAHLAAGPTHVEESTALALILAVWALVQVGWSLVVSWRCIAAVLAVGAVGNAAIVTLVVITQTSGPTLGFTRGTIDPWDLGCLLFEAVVVVCCARLLCGRRPRGRLIGWGAWHPVVRLWTLAAVAALVALVLAGWVG